MHILHIHTELRVDGSNSNENNREVIKEYHFYISDDRTHDTCFSQYCFDFFIMNYRYERSLLKNIGYG